MTPGLAAAALASVAVGIAIGLLITWGLWPVEFTNADPADLRPVHKDDYVRMISAAYARDGDLDAARQRLTQLGLRSPIQTLSALLAREKPADRTSAYAALEHLAHALGLKTAAAARSVVPGVGGEPANLTAAAVPTQVVPVFHLKERVQLTCSDEPGDAHLRFFVRDPKGRDLPNIGIEIRWATGDDTVYTGLKPERGLGYADFEAAPGKYSIALIGAASDSPVEVSVGNPPADCRADRGATPRGWKIVFQQK